ncbi:hypothetical protein ACQKIE_00105 [Luteibacter sp. NPDC031894]|uniref:hypothetical protein n=1 Tax=Luteibacter sp. NPDC031894 TaxID=3390572 RepID=UPI003D0939D4
MNGITKHPRFHDSWLIPGALPPTVIRPAPGGQWLAQVEVTSDYNIGAIGDSPKDAFLNMHAAYFDWLMEQGANSEAA